MLTAQKSEVENSNILKLRWDSQGNGRFTTDSQGHIQTSDGDPRTGTFPQMRVQNIQRDLSSKKKAIYTQSDIFSNFKDTYPNKGVSCYSSRAVRMEL